MIMLVDVQDHYLRRQLKRDLLKKIAIDIECIGGLMESPDESQGQLYRSEDRIWITYGGRPHAAVELAQRKLNPKKQKFCFEAIYPRVCENHVIKCDFQS